MLPKTRRLSRPDFLHLKSHGSIYRSSAFMAYYSPTSHGYSRISIITSSRLSKLAVNRNLLRRRIYSHLAAFLPSVDVIILPSRQMLNLTYAQLNLALDPFLSKISVI